MQRKSLDNIFINFINTFSIWVVLGSFSSYLFFCKIYTVAPNYIVAIGLALGVWFIYTLDHLLDGITLKSKASSKRHIEHYKNQKIIKALLVLVGVLLFVLALFVPRSYYEFIGLLLCLTGVHFMINYLVPAKIKKVIFLKEVFIALVVTLALVLTPYFEVQFKKVLIETKFLFGLFYFVNLSNLMLFSYFDKEHDEQTNTISLARIYSDQTLKTFIVISLIVGSLFGAISFSNLEIVLVQFLIFLLMIITLSLLVLFPTYFKQADRYRFWGDLIYVYPLIALPFL